MTEKLDKYILDVQIDNETGEEHCTILKTDRTTNTRNWITIINAMYTHHSVFEPLIKELNKLSDENEQIKQPNCRNCIHFSCDNADIYCMKKEYESIPDCSIAKDCDEYVGLYE